MGLPGDVAFGAADRDHAKAEDDVEHHPEAENREDAPVGEGLERLSSGTCARSASPGRPAKTNRKAAAIWPEIAADAPTTGIISPK
jgi:hypothetical protein